jgi:hypothetical protein
MTLGQAIGRLARQVRQERAAEPRGEQRRIDEGPRSAYELVTRRALEDLARDFERLESKVNGLIFGVLLTFILEVWKSFR